MGGSVGQCDFHLNVFDDGKGHIAVRSMAIVLYLYDATIAVVDLQLSGLLIFAIHTVMLTHKCTIFKHTHN